jgi:DUF4097 and DUF4098 domain-containing protein YvlB
MKTLKTAIVLLGLLAWSPFAGAYQKSIPVKGKVDVTVGTKSGDVKIVGWDRQKVKVEAEDDIGKYILVDGDAIRIGADADGKITRNISANMTVHVPAGSGVNAITISGDLSLENASGRLKVKTVSGDVKVLACSGHLSLTATSGDIRLENLKDDLSFKTVSGDVVGSNLQGRLLEGKTVSGSITLKNVDAGQVRLKTVSGDITLQGKFAADGSVKISTLSGETSLTLPPEAGFDVSARSRTGSVESDFELKVEESGEHQLEAKAGSGGTDIDLNSFSGDIQIKKQ